MSNCLKIMLLLVVMAACAGKKEQKKPFDISEPSAPKASTNNASTRVDLDSKGVGPIDSVHVPDEIRHWHNRARKFMRTNAHFATGWAKRLSVRRLKALPKEERLNGS